MVDVTTLDSPKPQVNGFQVAITAVLAMLAKRARRLSGKLKAAATENDWKIELRSPEKSELAKKLLSNIYRKTLPFVEKRKMKKKKKKKEGEEEWGDGGVWQKTILMGDKCEPLDFSGVIYYDSNGKQMNEVPIRSPRASPMPGYMVRQRQRKL